MMKVLRIIFAIIGGYFILIITLGLLYSLVTPVSTLMIGRWITFNEVKRDHVPLKSVNRNVLRSLIAAEDDEFCSHWGVNWNAMDKAIKNSMNNAISTKRKNRVFGASTISMQVAKNLFLLPQKFYLRKMLEIPIAIYLDLIWSKSRMIEIYLSIAEWGDGIFGIEAASKKYFHKSASKLTLRESALLVSSLPNPIKRHPDKPSSYMRSYSNTIMKRSYKSDLSCL